MLPVTEFDKQSADLACATRKHLFVHRSAAAELDGHAWFVSPVTGRSGSVVRSRLAPRASFDYRNPELCR